jgi:hypothetical protein
MIARQQAMISLAMRRVLRSVLRLLGRLTTHPRWGVTESEGKGAMGIAELAIASISALMKAIDTWTLLRDRRRARTVHDDTYQRALTDPRTREAAGVLTSVVPRDVVQRLQSRIEECWDGYRSVLDNDEKFQPREIDQATEATKSCVCRELRRIRSLIGELPAGPLLDSWNQFDCAVDG